MSREDILARYGDKESYLSRVRSDAVQLAEERAILPEDINLVVKNCAERWDVAGAAEADIDSSRPFPVPALRRPFA